MSTRLALGTVQFGLPYGVSNASGQVKRDEVHSILTYAETLNIDTLDTAIAYGETEAILGDIGVAQFNLVTKLPRCPKTVENVDDWLHSAIAASLERLGIERLYAVLLHHPHQLLDGQGRQIYAALERLKARDLTRKIGITVYAPEELDALCDRFRFDVVQAPINILDQRFFEAGWIVRLQEAGIELHARSVFLQGLLLMPASARPVYFERWKLVWEEWHRWLSEIGLSALEACMRYAQSLSGIDRIVVGVENVKQLREIVASGTGDLPSLPNWPKPLDVDLLNPSRWKLI